ncbi:unnamed protein product [Musa acuminata subsp. malaccensis]|uniref:Transcription repressor n=1 Tax=Musa acuminata subsp. malaccensis TaxID=214687 RepID=A0A804J9K4_MUSAM|nr:PREDICTED: transcription repressor OFP13-like [Musa acuminata subsp. malaccensis]CAG1840202.1 unnamed protein product [Musa acuminata subsp. malaccensis]
MKPSFASLFSRVRPMASSPPPPLLNESCLSNSSSGEWESFSDGDAVEAVIHGLRSSDRLFFEPGTTSSMVEEAAKSDVDGAPFEGSIAMAVESEDPYRDFKQSMEEMLLAHGVGDWAWLQQMLEWYLLLNGKKNHGFIIGAFMDLLLGIASSSSCSSSSSPSSSSSSSFTFEIEEEEEEVVEEEMM